MGLDVETNIPRMPNVQATGKSLNSEGKKILWDAFFLLCLPLSY